MIEPLPVLEAARVVLRPFTAADITPAYVGWLNDPEVVRYSNQRFRRHDAASCAAYLATFADSDNVFASIHLRESGRAVGTMTAYRARHHGTADVGILLGERTVWGRGIGQDAWNTLLDWLATLPGLRKITCGTLACNAAMRRLAERSGMELEAVRRAQELVDGRPEDIVHYARFAGAAAP
jgi:RimJ/RimL family protein N-acetyltransferase